MKKWNDAEVTDKMHEYFKVQNGKILVTLPGLNRLLMDPKCPEPQRSNLIEYLVKIRKDMELRKAQKRVS
jgi:hypothetical protein